MEKETQNSVKKHEKRLEAKGWPDISVEKFGKWGFDVSDVLRVPKYNFLVQPARTTVKETEGEEISFVLEGILYRINTEMERRLAKMIVPAAMLMMILVVGMLLAVWINWGLVAVMAFILLYVTAEGLVPLSLALFAGKTRSNHIVIPWGLINSVVHLPKSGVLLIGFGEGTGLAIQFHPETSELVFSRLKAGINEEAKTEVSQCRSVYHPPSD